MNFLDIIVPQYKEDEKVIANLLNSIAIQKKVKFDEIGIIIINDASDVILSDKFLKSYKNLNIKYIKNEKNVGPGVTRQNGINISKAKYITFVDADDILFRDEALYQMISILKQTNHNIVCASMVQEYMSDGELKNNLVPFNGLRTLHGLFVKRRYLLDNDIKFHPSLRYFEDTYFIQTLTHDNNYYPVNNIFYVWKYNEGSLTVGNNKYEVVVRHFGDFFISTKGIYEYYKKINLANKEIYLLQQLVEMALILNSSFFDYTELKEEKEEYERKVYDLYLENKDVLDSLSDIKRRGIINYQTNDVKKYYKTIILNSTFDEFLDKMNK